ncbi:uncharacterized protein IWZ02DRAFT_163521, partial [Phyllosticta citriasiana]
STPKPKPPHSTPGKPSTPKPKPPVVTSTVVVGPKPTPSKPSYPTPPHSTPGKPSTPKPPHSTPGKPSPPKPKPSTPGPKPPHSTPGKPSTPKPKPPHPTPGKPSTPGPKPPHSTPGKLSTPGPKPKPTHSKPHHSHSSTHYITKTIVVDPDSSTGPAKPTEIHSHPKPPHSHPKPKPTPVIITSSTPVPVVVTSTTVVVSASSVPIIVGSSSTVLPVASSSTVVVVQTTTTYSPIYITVTATPKIVTITKGGRPHKTKTRPSRPHPTPKKGHDSQFYAPIQVEGSNNTVNVIMVDGNYYINSNGDCGRNCRGKKKDKKDPEHLLSRRANVPEGFKSVHDVLPREILDKFNRNEINVWVPSKAGHSVYFAHFCAKCFIVPVYWDGRYVAPPIDKKDRDRMYQINIIGEKWYDRQKTQGWLKYGPPKCLSCEKGFRWPFSKVDVVSATPTPRSIYHKNTKRDISMPTPINNNNNNNNDDDDNMNAPLPVLPTTTPPYKRAFTPNVQSLRQTPPPAAAAAAAAAAASPFTFKPRVSHQNSAPLRAPAATPRPIMMMVQEPDGHFATRGVDASDVMPAPADLPYSFQPAAPPPGSRKDQEKEKKKSSGARLSATRSMALVLLVVVLSMCL